MTLIVFSHSSKTSEFFGVPCKSFSRIFAVVLKFCHAANVLKEAEVLWDSEEVMVGIEDAGV